METYNNKKREFNICGDKGAFSKNGKLKATDFLAKMEQKFQEQIYSSCAFIRLIALALIDSKVFKLTTDEKDGVFYLLLSFQDGYVFIDRRLICILLQVTTNIFQLLLLSVLNL
jgi:hypothetical protein